MLHAWLFTQSGIPVIYSGDEIGQLNDYTYKKDPEKWADSRYLHRGKFPWEKVEKKDPISMRIFNALRVMEKLRAEHAIFSGQAGVETMETGSRSVLGILRYLGMDQHLRAYFNFSRTDTDGIWSSRRQQKSKTDDSMRQEGRTGERREQNTGRRKKVRRRDGKPHPRGCTASFPPVLAGGLDE